jgi:ABC-type multidrug transport system permease subunit
MTVVKEKMRVLFKLFSALLISQIFLYFQSISKSIQLPANWQSPWMIVSIHLFHQLVLPYSHDSPVSPHKSHG